MVIAVFLFRERKAVGGKRDLADIIIFYGDGDEGLHGMYVERDTAALFFRDLRDRLDRVVHEISEERIQVAVADEREPAAFRHAGQIDLLVLADEALFGEQDVHRLVARVHERVVDGGRLADLFRLRALDVALSENAVDLMPYVMALYVDQLYVLLVVQILRLRLPQHLADHLFLVRDLLDLQEIELNIEHEQTAKDVETVVHDPARPVGLCLVHDKGVEHDVHEQGKRGDEQELNGL